jgi:hypothetical protein
VDRQNALDDAKRQIEMIGKDPNAFQLEQDGYDTVAVEKGAEQLRQRACACLWPTDGWARLCD